LKYQDYVKKGRALLEELEDLKEIQDCYQSKIAKYALSVCDIRHGGQSGGLYTMKDYALDIGANPKTLSNWVAIYKNVLVKIGIEDPTIEERRKARKVNKV